MDTWVKCLSCRSVFRDITSSRFRQIHSEAFQDGEFIESSVAASGGGPATSVWDVLRMPGSSLLEIGPGAGQLLAAAKQAGRSVTAVESSGVHRKYIREKWDINSIYPSLSELPENRTFDAIVAINMFEHVYDIAGFLRSVQRVLAPEGVFFLSTANAISLEAAVLRTWWSMCKVHDHVSFPSPEGLTAAARANGFAVDRIWSTELPLEFPVSALISARDRFRARTASGRHTGSDSVATVGTTAAPGTPATSVKARFSRFYSTAASYDPTSRLLGALGRGASIKALLRPAG